MSGVPGRDWSVGTRERMLLAAHELGESLEDLSRAACRGRDPRWWDLDQASREELAEAIRICGWCPVREACLDQAIRMKARGTVWGGLKFPNDNTKRWQPPRERTGDRQWQTA